MWHFIKWVLSIYNSRYEKPKGVQLDWEESTLLTSLAVLNSQHFNSIMHPPGGYYKAGETEAWNLNVVIRGIQNQYLLLVWEPRGFLHPAQYIIILFQISEDLNPGHYPFLHTPHHCSHMRLEISDLGLKLAPLLRCPLFQTWFWLISSERTSTTKQHSPFSQSPATSILQKVLWDLSVSHSAPPWRSPIWLIALLPLCQYIPWAHKCLENKWQAGHWQRMPTSLGGDNNNPIFLFLGNKIIELAADMNLPPTLVTKK